MRELSEYEKQIDSLIPEAEYCADVECRKRKVLDVEGFEDIWNKVFHKKMKELARKKGFRLV